MAQIIKDLITQPLAGENLTANGAVYISDGTGADAARDAGKAYKFDPTTAGRDTFAGFVKATVLADDYAKIVTSGRVKGFTGLSQGKTIYAHASIPGAYTAVEPSLSYPLGVAENATTVVVSSGFGKQENLSGKAIIDPSQSDVKKDTEANLTSYASTAGNGQLCFATDTKLMYQVVDGALTEVGGGGGSGGGLDTYFSDDLSATGASDFTVGNDATFQGTDGSLGGDGTLADNTVTPMNGAKSILYTSDSTTPANSLNDYYYSPVIPVTKLQRDYDNGITLWVRSEIDAEVVVWDVTNSKKLNSVLDKTGVTGSNESRYSASFFIPESCLEVQYGFHILTTPTAVSQELEFTNIELSTNPFIYKDIVETQSVGLSGLAGFGSTATKVPYFTNTYRENGSGIYTISKDSTNGTVVTMLRDATVTITYSTGSSSSQTIPGITLNSSDVTASISSLAQDEVVAKGCIRGASSITNGTISWSENVSAGDIIRPQNTDATSENVSDWKFSVSASATSEHVITPAKSNLTDWTSYTPTTQGIGTPANIDLKYRRVGSDLEVRGRLDVGSPTAVEARIGLPSGLTSSSDINANGEFAGGTVTSGNAAAGRTAHAVIHASQTYVNYSYGDNTRNFYTKDNGNAIWGVSETISIYFKVPIEGWSSDATFLAANPTPKIAYLKDIKPSGTDGGAFSSGSYLTRDLNDLSGNTDFVSLSASQFTLKPGKHDIYWSAPGSNISKHKSKLYDVTNGADVKMGSSEETATGAIYVTRSNGFTTVEITEETTYEIRHRCSVTSSTGFGRACSFGDYEEYTQVKIVNLR